MNKLTIENMNKTFNQLTVGDKFYSVYDNSMEYQTLEVQEVNSSEIIFGYGSNKIKRFKESNGIVEEYSRFGDGKKTFYFVNESDAIRFCKARLMKTLFGKIKSAKNTIAELKAFREKHFELLNHDWTEREINKLERSFN